MHESGLLDLLRTTAFLAEAAFDRAVAYTGLGTGQARILRAVAANQGTTGSALSEHLHLDKSTVSTALRLLAKVGYTVAHPDPYDRRGRIHRTTSMGATVAADIVEVAESIARIMQYEVAEDDRPRIKRLLTGMAANLGYELRHPGRRCTIFPELHQTLRHSSEGPLP